MKPRPSILVIDDSLDTLQLQKILFELEGYEVFTAASGAEALRLLGEIARPDMILLDMQIGDMTGTEFLARLESINPQLVDVVPVVFMTGMDSVPKTKAVGFIRKPADNDAILKTVHRFIEGGQHAAR